MSAAEKLKLMKGTTQEVTAVTRAFGNTMGSAIGTIGSAMSYLGGGGYSSGCGGGGGGSGCRTFATGTVMSGGGNLVGGGGGASGSPGMLWYNVLGNENAAAVAVMGEKWASTVSNVKRNSCSGQVCSFEADGQTFYGDGSGSFTSVNDALITNRGEVIQFHPDDNILAFKDSSKLKGRGIVINNTFNINGSGDPDRIAELIMKKIEKIQRMS